MGLLLKNLKALSESSLKPKCDSLDSPVSFSFRVQAFDLDALGHMNNARYFNYLEAGRWGLLYQSRLFQMSLKKKWKFPISEIQIQFFRPLKLFQKFELKTQFLSLEGRWFYLYQEIQLQGRVATRALIKSTAYHSEEGSVSLEGPLGELSYLPLKPELSRKNFRWLRRFIDLNQENFTLRSD